jgi:hypothetical protein
LDPGGECGGGGGGGGGCSGCSGGGGVGSGGGGGGDNGGGGYILQGWIAFYWEDISVVFLCVERIGVVTPQLTLLSRLRYVGVLLGGDGNGPQKLWYVNTKNYLAKKALQLKLVVIYTKVLRPKNEP